MGNKENFDKWQEQWDKAMKSESFKPAVKPPTEVKKGPDFFGNFQPKDKFSLNEVDTQYWKRVYKLSKNPSENPDIFKELTGIPNIEDDPLQSKSDEKDDEGNRETPDRNNLGDKTKKMANTANPVIPSTIGKDQRPVVTADWSDGGKLREINDMKISLHALQGKLNANPRFGAYGKEAPQIVKIQDQIDELIEKIDNLSNSLSPDFVADEES